jgi:hypothetical protein
MSGCKPLSTKVDGLDAIALLNQVRSILSPDIKWRFMESPSENRERAIKEMLSRAENAIKMAEVMFAGVELYFSTFNPPNPQGSPGEAPVHPAVGQTSEDAQ